MPLINCKIYLKSTWIENCVLSSDGCYATFRLTDTKSCIPVVTLSTEDKVKSSKHLSDRFKRSVY